MFGYVVTYPPEMKVKEERLYKAIYCGLCDEIKKKVSLFLLPALNYDFVFLGAFLSAINGTKLEIGTKRCLFHPTKKKPIVLPNKDMEYCAVMHLFLTELKISDDIRDPETNFVKKLGLRIYRSLISRKVAKFCRDEKYSSVYEKLSRILKEGAEAEERKAGLDEMCANFGSVLSEIAFSGADLHRDKAHYVGEMLGRFIYTADALDDVFDDEKSKSFNPFLEKYGSAKETFLHFSEIDCVTSFYVSEIAKTLDGLKTDDMLFGILFNVTDFGLGGRMEKISKKGDLNERSV